MAGHVMVRYFREQPGFGVFYTSRDRSDPNAIYLDASLPGMAESIIDVVRPDVVVNGIGILNQDAVKREREAVQINGLLPHQLRKKLDAVGGKLVHISTDCVFSGSKGDYTEQDPPDGDSAYARTKAIGEVRSDNHLTVRTSIIGPEIRPNGMGLFDWFMKQQGTVQGYTAAMWNGVTTVQLARSVHELLKMNVTGLIHLTAPEKISKHDLLLLFQEVFGKHDVTVEPYDGFVQDRTLRNTRTDFQVEVPGYPQMIREMRDWMERA